MAETPSPTPSDGYNGWHSLAEKLKKDGFSDEELKAVFNDERMQPFSFVSFSLVPHESYDQYQSHYRPHKIKVGKECLSRYKDYFKQASERFHVAPNVIASVMLIETFCGRFTGNTPIFGRLARLANIDDPENLQHNFKRHHELDASVTFEDSKNRAAYLVNTFYPEILALFKISKDTGSDVFEIKGSVAGAFGLTQFLPSSFLKFGIDGDNNGTISLFTPADAISSTAHFLSSYGWDDSASRDEKKRIIWKYNHSEAYVDTILNVADLLVGKKIDPKTIKR